MEGGLTQNAGQRALWRPSPAASHGPHGPGQAAGRGTRSGRHMTGRRTMTRSRREAVSPANGCPLPTLLAPPLTLGVGRFRATALRPRRLPVAKRAATQMGRWDGPGTHARPCSHVCWGGRAVQSFSRIRAPKKKNWKYAHTRTTCGEQEQHHHETSPVSQQYDESPRGKTGFSPASCRLRIRTQHRGGDDLATSALSSDQIRWICMDACSRLP